MAFSIEKHRDRPGAPRVEVYPACSFAKFFHEIAPSGTVFIKHGTSAATYPASNNWLLGTRPILSWCMRPITESASLRVSVSYDEVNWVVWNCFPLVVTVMNEASGVEVPGWMARLELVNASTSGTCYVTGMVKAQGVT